jgi:hypothetical protein
MLLVRVALRGLCCVRGVTEETLVPWRRRAAHQAAVLTPPAASAAGGPGTPRRDGARQHAHARV